MSKPRSENSSGCSRLGYIEIVLYLDEFSGEKDYCPLIRGLFPLFGVLLSSFNTDESVTSDSMIDSDSKGSRPVSRFFSAGVDFLGEPEPLKANVGDTSTLMTTALLADFLISDISIDVYLLSRFLTLFG